MPHPLAFTQHKTGTRAVQAFAFGLAVVSAAAPAMAAQPAPTEARPDEPPAIHGLILTPYVGLQGTYTDNVALLNAPRTQDFITAFQVGSTASINDTKLIGAADAKLTYDTFAVDHKNNGALINGYGALTYNILDNLLAFNAAAAQTYGNSASFGSTDVPRANSNGQFQTTNYFVGPSVKTTIFGLADLNASAYYEQLFYSQSGAGTGANGLPSQSSMNTANLRLDTADRLGALEMITFGAYQHGENGFEAENAMESVYFKVLPKIRLIARGGYDHVAAATIKTLDDGLWSVGAEYSINDHSKASLEGGQRYGRPYWAGHADIQLSGKLFLLADYNVAVQDSISSIGASLMSLSEAVNLTPSQTTPLTQNQVAINNTLNSLITRDRSGSIAIAYRSEIDTIQGSANTIDRELLTVNSHDITTHYTFEYIRRMREDLHANLAADYATNHLSVNSPVFTGSNGNYKTLLAGFIYNLNSKSDLKVSYRYTDSNSRNTPLQNYYENAVTIIITRKLNL